MLKAQRHHSIEQAEINELLYEAAISGKTVVRLKGGDPMLFAHGGEEIDYLERRQIEVRVVPGITAALAAAACYACPANTPGIASSVSFITGHANRRSRFPYQNARLLHGSIKSSNYCGGSRSKRMVGRHPCFAGIQCFRYRSGGVLYDTAKNNRTTPSIQDPFDHCNWRSCSIETQLCFGQEQIGVIRTSGCNWNVTATKVLS